MLESKKLSWLVTSFVATSVWFDLIELFKIVRISPDTTLKIHIYIKSSTRVKPLFLKAWGADFFWLSRRIRHIVFPLANEFSEALLTYRAANLLHSFTGQ